MRRIPDEDADEFGDPGGLDPLDDFGLISPEMTEEFARYIGDRWRAIEDNKPISVNITLGAALNRTPSLWLAAACDALRVNLRAGRGTRRARAEALAASLGRNDELARFALALPPYARAALRRVLDNGGWIRLGVLLRDFGGMDGDGWFWNEQPPTSSVGELRRRALLFVGRASLPRAGGRTRALCKIAVVPRELRAPLAAILSDALVRQEDELALAAYFASPDDLLREALVSVARHYELAALPPPLKRADTEGFLRLMTREGLNPLLVWTNLDILLQYCEVNAHEIRALDDLCGYHLSELATKFVDGLHLQRWSLAERRALVCTVRSMVDHLLADGRVAAETHEDIVHACRRICSGKRRLTPIQRPPPIGGELLLMCVNPNSGEEQALTFNHQRLLLVWAGVFHRDWRALLHRCQDVPSGADKAALIQDLIALDPRLCELLLARADDDDARAAADWFSGQTLLFVSVW